MKSKHLPLMVLMISVSIHAFAQDDAAKKALDARKADSAKATEVWKPIPIIVTTGAANSNAPSDAMVLFDGSNLEQWRSVNDSTQPAKWTIGDNSFTVKKGTGNIETKRRFNNYQLHLEWRVPANITGSGQSRGNSGLFLASTGPGDEGYELQILDCYNNSTYVNGQVGSIYKQAIPLANASKKPGEWQTYDVVWTAPVFNSNGSLKSPGYVTAFHNGIIVQNHTKVKGVTAYIGKPKYKKHGPATIKLQDHGDPSEPDSFRNIWIREL